MVYLYLSIESLKILFIHSAFNAKPVKIVHASTSACIFLAVQRFIRDCGRFV